MVDRSPMPDFNLFSAEEILCAMNDDGNQEDLFSLDCVGVPDTACRRTLVGAYTLSCNKKRLRKQDLKVKRRGEQAKFKCGNSGTLLSHS